LNGDMAMYSLRGEQPVTCQVLLARLGMSGPTCDATSSSPGPVSKTQFLVPAQPCRVRRQTNFLSAFLDHLL
jgi:hypothetical protein